MRYCAEDVYQGGPVLCLEKVSVKFGLWVQIGKFATSEILNWDAPVKLLVYDASYWEDPLGRIVTLKTAAQPHIHSCPLPLVQLLASGCCVLLQLVGMPG